MNLDKSVNHRISMNVRTDRIIRHRSSLMMSRSLFDELITYGASYDTELIVWTSRDGSIRPSNCNDIVKIFVSDDNAGFTISQTMKVSFINKLIARNNLLLSSIENVFDSIVIADIDCELLLDTSEASEYLHIVSLTNHGLVKSVFQLQKGE